MQSQSETVRHLEGPNRPVTIAQIDEHLSLCQVSNHNMIELAGQGGMTSPHFNHESPHNLNEGSAQKSGLQQANVSNFRIGH